MAQPDRDLVQQTVARGVAPGQARAYQLRARRLAPGYRRARVELAKLDRLERDTQDDDS